MSLQSSMDEGSWDESSHTVCDNNQMVDYCWHSQSHRLKIQHGCSAFSCGGSKPVNKISRLAPSTFVVKKYGSSGVYMEYWDVRDSYPQQHHFHVVEFKSSTVAMCSLLSSTIVVVFRACSMR